MLSNKVYDILKWIALIALDALGLLYKTLAAIWGWPFGDEVLATCTALSLCLGTPVVGTHMGGIPELIDYSNGIVARPMALATALEQAYMRTWDYQEISRDAVELFDPELHYARLMKIYGE